MDSLYIYRLNMYKSSDLKAYLVGMTVVLHKHKVTHGKCVVFTYICCRMTSGQFQYHLSQAMRKCVLCHMQTTKAQISLRIPAV